MASKYYLHLLWLIPDYSHSLYHLIYGREVQHISLHYILDRQGYLALIIIGFYMYKSFRLVKVYNEKLPRVYSSLVKLKLDWLHNLMKFWSIIFVFAFVQGSIDMFYDLEFDVLEVIHLVFTFSIFWLGLNGIAHQFNKVDLTGSKTQKISSSKASIILKEVMEVIELEKLYLDPELSLHKLQHRIDTFSAREISSTLNQKLHKNFHSFINEYRIEEFKQKVSSGGCKHKTLYGIAQDSGFNSKATFNRVFKSITNMSPREYISSLDIDS